MRLFSSVARPARPGLEQGRGQQQAKPASRSTGRLLAGLVSAMVGGLWLSACGQKGALYLPASVSNATHSAASGAAPAASANASPGAAR